ncbi:acyltransferase [Flavobacterium sp. Sd200]|uniref:acyltransferase n=1 Tax=Flavobacterium sp. Sd200 TaxID=2692211 RepID=UPI001F39EDB7|nr:acyltransferase [Flavobacterium sp. Sd200]
MFIKRHLLKFFYKYEIHKTAHIGLSWIYPKKLTMGPNSRIGHFNTAVHLDEIILGERVSIGRGNWITGFATGTASKHFKHQPERKSILSIGDHSAITKNHHIDCTSPIIIGKFVTIAGYQSQFLSHSINVYDNRQDSKQIVIGDYCFVGTNVVMLGGAVLPGYSVLGAKSLLNKAYTEEWKLYGGNPAKPILDIDKNAKYFSRDTGFVV